MKIFLLCVIFSTSAFAQIYGDVKAHFRINASETMKVDPSVPSTIEVWFTDTKTEEVLKDYKEMHGKIMHMVLIKDDLSEFKHIHPYFDPVTGRFQITINMPLSDPDNFHTKETLTTPGMYMLMADVEPRGYGMRMGHIMLMAKGAPTIVPLALDPVDGDLSISKTFTQYNKDYKIKMSYETTSGCSGRLVEFQTTLYTKSEDGSYVEATNLNPWLSQGAHSVWVSENMMDGMKMRFAHMHSKIPEMGSSHFFNFHDDNIMQPGVQKIWFQIKHEENVLTIPVIFEYYPIEETISCK